MPRLPALLSVLLALAGSPLAQAQAELAPGRVVRAESEVLLLPEGWDEWRSAEPNAALAPGDWLRTGRGAGASLEPAPSVLVQAGEWTELRFDRDREVLVLELHEGRAVICSSLAAEGLRVWSPHGTAWLEPGGFYMAEVGGGLFTLEVSSGRAEAEVEGRVRRVAPGRLAEMSSSARRPTLRRSSSLGLDSLAREAQLACREIAGGQADLGLVGERALRENGRWIDISGQRHWRPHGLSVGWRPFGDGSFRWHPRWGWYFVAHQPWGWVTHHHGWWSYHDPWGWVWYPDSWWRPHSVVFRVVDRDLYWCPRTGGRGRERGEHRDRDHDREVDVRGWSRAPIDEFGIGTLVRARPALGVAGLPRLSPRDEDERRAGPPGSVIAPPLPPRAREPRRPGLAGGEPILGDERARAESFGVPVRSRVPAMVEGSETFRRPPIERSGEAREDLEVLSPPATGRIPPPVRPRGERAPVLERPRFPTELPPRAPASPGQEPGVAPPERPVLPPVLRPELSRPRPEIRRPDPPPVERPELRRPDPPSVERPEIRRPRPEIRRPDPPPVERPELQRPDPPSVERPEIRRPDPPPVERPESQRPDPQPPVVRSEPQRPAPPPVVRPEIRRPAEPSTRGRQVQPRPAPPAPRVQPPPVRRPTPRPPPAPERPPTPPPEQPSGDGEARRR